MRIVLNFLNFKFPTIKALTKNDKTKNVASVLRKLYKLNSHCKKNTKNC